MKTLHLSPWKYYIGPGLWRECSTLYATLDEALLHCSDWDSIRPVPSGHAPWKPFVGRPDNETSPLRAELTSWPWKVLRVRKFDECDTDDSFPRYIGAFDHPRDAFAFAELATKRAAERRDKSDTFHVCLWAWTEDGRTPEIARLPANHLTELRRARDRAEKRRHRRAT